MEKTIVPEKKNYVFFFLPVFLACSRHSWSLINKYLLHAFYVPGAALSAWDTLVH